MSINRYKLFHLEQYIEHIPTHHLNNNMTSFKLMNQKNYFNNTVNDVDENIYSYDQGDSTNLTINGVASKQYDGRFYIAMNNRYKVEGKVVNDITNFTKTYMPLKTANSFPRFQYLVKETENKVLTGVTKTTTYNPDFHKKTVQDAENNSIPYNLNLPKTIVDVNSKSGITKTKKFQYYHPTNQTLETVTVSNLKNETIVNNAISSKALSGSFVYGKPIRSYTTISDATDNISFIDQVHFYNSDYLLNSTVDPKGNVTKYYKGSPNPVSINRYHNYTVHDSYSKSFTGTDFSNSTLETHLPTGLTTKLSIEYDPYHQTARQAVNDYGLDVIYDYDQLGRVKEIAGPNYINFSGYTNLVESIDLDLSSSVFTKTFAYEFAETAAYLDYSSSLGRIGLAATLSNGVMNCSNSKENHTPEYLAFIKIDSSVLGSHSNLVSANLNFTFVNNFTGSKPDISIAYANAIPETGCYSNSVTSYQNLFGLEEMIVRGDDGVNFQVDLTEYYNKRYPNLFVNEENTTTTDDLIIVIRLDNHTGLNQNEYYTVSNPILKINKRATGSQRKASIAYKYDSDNNQIQFKQANDFGSDYSYKRSDFNFNAFNKLSSMRAFEDYSYNNTNSRFLENVYEYDGLVKHTLDEYGHKSENLHNGRRELIEIKNYEKVGANFIERSNTLIDTEIIDLTELNALFSSIGYTNYSLNHHLTDFFIKNTTTDEDGFVSVTVKDIADNLLIQINNKNGSGIDRAVIAYIYDNENRLIKVIHPNAFATDGTFNEQMTTRYTYENLYGFLKTRTSPDNGLTSYFYDQFGRLRYSQDARQAAISGNKRFVYYNYDSMDRLTSQGYRNSTADYNLIASKNPDELYLAQTFENEANHTIINQYDLAPNWASSMWSSLSSTYRPNATYMKGDLVATAWRHDETDLNWKYKTYQKNIFGQIEWDLNDEGDFAVKKYLFRL